LNRNGTGMPFRDESYRVIAFFPPLQRQWKNGQRSKA
jgi:hypothetical protein